MLKKILITGVVAAMTAGFAMGPGVGLATAAPVYHGHPTMHHHHHRHQVCRTVWHHHHRVRVCKWAW